MCIYLSIQTAAFHNPNSGRSGYALSNKRFSTFIVSNLAYTCTGTVADISISVQKSLECEFPSHSSNRTHDFSHFSKTHKLRILVTGWPYVDLLKPPLLVGLRVSLLVVFTDSHTHNWLILQTQNTHYWGTLCTRTTITGWSWLKHPLLFDLMYSNTHYWLTLCTQTPITGWPYRSQMPISGWP